MNRVVNDLSKVIPPKLLVIFALTLPPASVLAGPVGPGPEASALPALGRGLGALIRDESLSRAARRHGAALLGGRAQARWSDLRSALWKEGLADAQVLPFAAFSPSVPELEVLALRYFDERVSERGFTHYGLATFTQDGRHGLAIFFVRRLVELPPLPSGRAPRSLRGLLLTPAREVEGFFTLTSGEVRRAAAERRDRSVRVRAPEEGEISALEMVVHTARGPEVAAQVTYRSLPRASAARVTDPASLRADLDVLRRSVGSGRLENSASLTTAASDHARWVCDHRLAVHLRPDGEGPIERAKRVGHRGPVFENIAIASSLAEAHQNLLHSPSHRMNLLAPEAKKLGLGVAERMVAGDRMICVVQLFGGDALAPSAEAQSGL